MSKSIADILDKAADLIEPEGAWTQEAFSRDAQGAFDGDLVAVGKPVCWCALGAIAEVVGHEPNRPWIDNQEAVGVLRFIETFVPGSDMPDFNDTHTQADVVAKLREAAAVARERSL